jgi:hypothetical protein
MAISVAEGGHHSTLRMESGARPVAIASASGRRLRAEHPPHMCPHVFDAWLWAPPVLGKEFAIRSMCHVPAGMTKLTSGIGPIARVDKPGGIHAHLDFGPLEIAIAAHACRVIEGFIGEAAAWCGSPFHVAHELGVDVR